MTATGQPDPDLGPVQEGPAAIVRGVALLARFLLELALYVTVAYVVYTVSGRGSLRGIAAGAAVVAVGAVWSVWLSRRATHRPAEPVRLLLEVLLFAGCGAALWGLGHPVLGAALVAAWVADRVVLASVRPVT
ncbi:YrdB family protein [Xylanimonas protaetiae]|nr:YrdB family protein [Xylanimonas protaetiae]